MLISKKSKEIVDSCRFCWMCRHICPIGNATGQERNTARARALTLSLVEREGAEFESGIIDNLYECALCGACTNNCMTGWDPVKFTKEARNEAAMTGKLPAYVEKCLDNIEESGNVYGAADYCDCIKTAAKDNAAETDTLLYIGADARYAAPSVAANAINMLNKNGVKFTVLADEPDSGFALDFLVGAADETKTAMTKCAAVLNNYKTVICLDPTDAKIIVREYKEYGIDVTAEVKTFTAFVAEAIASGAVKASKSDKAYFIQDNALLARELEETETLRDIANACGEAKEMLLNRKEVMWAGSSMMALWLPKVMELVAARRWADLKHVGGNAMVVASAGEYAALKAVKPEDCELYFISEVI